MAARVPKQAATSAAPKGAAGANDLSILHPDQTMEIAGQTLSVREYRHVEGLQLRARYKPFFEALYALFNVEGASPGFDEIAELMVEHEDAMLGLVSASAGVPREWIKQLDDQDGDALMLAWWAVNSPFFIRWVLRRAAQAGLRKALPSAGPGSSTTSSPPDTSAPPPSSPSSPPAS